MIHQINFNLKILCHVGLTAVKSYQVHSDEGQFSANYTVFLNGSEQFKVIFSSEELEHSGRYSTLFARVTHGTVIRFLTNFKTSWIFP